MRRPGLSALVRVAAVWVVTALTLMLLSALLAGFDVVDLGLALVAAALIGLLNALVWPLVVRVALPLTVLTLGLGPLLLNGACRARWWPRSSPESTVSGLGVGVVVTLGMTLANAAVTSLLAIDDDEVWYRNVVRRQARRLRACGDLSVPGVYFLEIDGLAHEVRSARNPRREHAEPGPMAARREPPAHAVGDRLVVPDRRLPGRPPPR